MHTRRVRDAQFLDVRRGEMTRRNKYKEMNCIECGAMVLIDKVGKYKGRGNCTNCNKAYSLIKDARVEPLGVSKVDKFDSVPS